MTLSNECYTFIWCRRTSYQQEKLEAIWAPPKTRIYYMYVVKGKAHARSAISVIDKNAIRCEYADKINFMYRTTEDYIHVHVFMYASIQSTLGRWVQLYGSNHAQIMHTHKQTHTLNTYKLRMYCIGIITNTGRYCRLGLSVLEIVA